MSLPFVLLIEHTSGRFYMSIETTINISSTNKVRLIQYSQQLDISSNELIIKLLVKYLNSHHDKYKIYSRVKYQKLADGDSWKRVHVWFSPEFYEKCFGLRLFLKLSLSNILSQAIELYLEDILKGECDNYEKNFIFQSSVYRNCPIFIITWNYPGSKIAEKILEIYEYT